MEIHEDQETITSQHITQFEHHIWSEQSLDKPQYHWCTRTTLLKEEDQYVGTHHDQTINSSAHNNHKN